MNPKVLNPVPPAYVLARLLNIAISIHTLYGLVNDIDCLDRSEMIKDVPKLHVCNVLRKVSNINGSPISGRSWNADSLISTRCRIRISVCRLCTLNRGMEAESVVLVVEILLRS